MITDFLQQLWLQQDGATYHIIREAIDLLRTKFGNRVNNRFGDVHWPALSCDLTPLNNFLLGNVEDRFTPTTHKQLMHLRKASIELFAK